MNCYIAAPFGNYIHRSGISSVMGTFTLKERTGLILQLIRTLRYSFKDQAWYNSLGLRNPGILEGLRRYDKNSRQWVNDWNKLKHSQKYPNQLQIIISQVTSSKDVACWTNPSYIIDFNPNTYVLMYIGVSKNSVARSSNLCPWPTQVPVLTMMTVTTTRKRTRNWSFCRAQSFRRCVSALWSRARKSPTRSSKCTKSSVM